MSKEEILKASGKTALKRKDLSAPVKWCIKEGFLNKKSTTNIFDWGCGKGYDFEKLREMGYDTEGYDLNHKKELVLEKFDFSKVDMLHLIYVLNVIPETEQKKLLDKIKKYYKKGKMLVAVRSDTDINRNAKKSNWVKKGKGFITKIGTYQQGFSKNELEKLLNNYGKVEKIVKKSGVYAIIELG